MSALDELLVCAYAGKPYTRWSEKDRRTVVEYFSEWVTGKHRGLPGKRTDM